MTRRHGRQGGDRVNLPNAANPRVCPTRFTEGPPGSEPVDVPHYLVGAKPNRKYKLMERRATMKAKMALKSGTTGYGCAPGCFGRIVFSLSPRENELLNSMGNDGEDEAVGEDIGDASDDPLFGHFMLMVLLQ